MSPRRSRPGACDPRIARIGALIQGDASLAHRTSRVLRSADNPSEVPAVSPRMHATAIRLPEDLVRRLDALIPKMARDPVASAQGTVDRSAVHRMALAEGILILEARYGGKGRKA